MLLAMPVVKSAGDGAIPGMLGKKKAPAVPGLSKLNSVTLIDDRTVVRVVLLRFGVLGVLEHERIKIRPRRIVLAA